MKHPYDDIIDLPHHVSKSHPQMSMYNRAAQFAPFAALTGHNAAITEAARLTETEQELSESDAEVLNRKLAFILQHIKDYILVEIVYFEPDGKKAGGSYRTKAGFIKESNPLAGTLEMDDGSLIPIRHIRDIKGDCFEE
ncbi:hypothetical protein B5F34_02605 [Mediterranea sp. An20]|uniref:hypothetical protein n=1 Tax=Mediterranea sp. An20 TaxID=1965586 RepID=UPI000B3748F2|nr:hypothetical protein [Mediterranea sp. An20]OUP11414.1 hypothetical protein B5F34_02605 [Mediterranea sp. An20]